MEDPCRLYFFVGYPITPATDILLYIIRERPKVGGIAIGAQDKIASMGFYVSVAMTKSDILIVSNDLLPIQSKANVIPINFKQTGLKRQ
ncbi:MAG: hypothetical protein A2030_00280 [Chloroflexi bacterium RBG_19FT_COMBO_50_10]|nr:MAG: hypothetical protein A2030_00280 [Chloroflexi bacterium RBG_19FT_COMBO_50_10]